MDSLASCDECSERQGHPSLGQNRPYAVFYHEHFAMVREHSRAIEQSAAFWYTENSPPSRRFDNILVHLPLVPRDDPKVYDIEPKDHRIGAAVAIWRQQAVAAHHRTSHRIADDDPLVILKELFDAREPHGLLHGAGVPVRKVNDVGNGDLLAEHVGIVSRPPSYYLCRAQSGEGSSELLDLFHPFFLVDPPRQYQDPRFPSCFTYSAFHDLDRGSLEGILPSQEIKDGHALRIATPGYHSFPEEMLTEWQWSNEGYTACSLAHQKMVWP